jgi:predicted transcriptional regulator
MKLPELLDLINGELLTNKKSKNQEILGAMGADLMSDVLASILPEAALLTGLCNPQVVRTALIADIRAIVFVRGKSPDEETLRIADEEKIPLITTSFGMFEACGILHQAGLPSLEMPANNSCA